MEIDPGAVGTVLAGLAPGLAVVLVELRAVRRSLDNIATAIGRVELVELAPTAADPAPAPAPTRRRAYLAHDRTL